MDVRLQPSPFDPGALLTEFTAKQSASGAVVSFTGITRDLDGALIRMEIEHYPAMTEKALASIARQAQDRWDLEDILILHRYGSLLPQEPIMIVATASKHRKAAFEAADFLKDYLKSRAPIWKKEIN